MRRAHDLILREIENYLNTIFELREEVATKDFKILMLEMELNMEKQLLASMKNNYFMLSVN